MEYLHKICEIYAMPPNDTRKVLDILIGTGLLVSECWDKDGRFKFEVFEKDPPK